MCATSFAASARRRPRLEPKPLPDRKRLFHNYRQGQATEKTVSVEKKMPKAAEERLREMLEKAGLPVKSSYRRAEVCAVLGCSERTYWVLIERFERDPETGAPRRPDSLDSYMFRRERRVPFGELTDYLRRNNTYHRRYALDERQMRLFE